MAGKVVHGPALIHVGERKPGDPKYATDEYLYAMPGSIVAPRRHNEKPTPANAARAIVAKGKELGILDGNTTPADLMNGGTAMKGPTAYKTYAATAGRSSRLGKAKAGTGVRFTAKRPVKRGSGPKIFNRLTGADAGAAVDPYTEALRAIQMVASSGDMTPEAAAGVLNNPVTSQGPQTAIPVAEGAASMSDFLKNLLGGAGLTGPDLLLAQMSIMNSLGQVDPRALGITDPAKFRELLGQGQGFNTLDKQKQLFNEGLYGFQSSSPNRGRVPTVSGG